MPGRRYCVCERPITGATGCERCGRRMRMPRAKGWEITCISLFRADLDRMDAMVDQLKRRGGSRMNRSALIRYAIRRLEATEGWADAWRDEWADSPPTRTHD